MASSRLFETASKRPEHPEISRKGFILVLPEPPPMFRPRLSDEVRQALHDLSEAGQTTEDVIWELIESSEAARRDLDQAELEREQQRVLNRLESVLRSRMRDLSNDELELLASGDWTTDTPASPTEEGRRGRELVEQHDLKPDLFGSAREQRDLERDLRLSAGELTIHNGDVVDAAQRELARRRSSQQQTTQRGGLAGMVDAIFGR